MLFSDALLRSQVWIRLQRAGGVQERRNDDLYTLPDPYERCDCSFNMLVSSVTQLHRRIVSGHRSEDWMQQYLPHLKALITVQRVTKDSVRYRMAPFGTLTFIISVSHCLGDCLGWLGFWEPFGVHFLSGIHCALRG